MPQLDLYILCINLVSFSTFFFFFYIIFVNFFLVKIARGIFFKHFFFNFSKFLPKYISIYEYILSKNIFKKILNYLDYRYMILKKLGVIYLCFFSYKMLFFFDLFICLERVFFFFYIRVFEFYFFKKFFVKIDNLQKFYRRKLINVY